MENLVEQRFKFLLYKRYRLMKKTILLFTILTSFTSCSTSFDFKAADKLVETLKGDSKIYRLTNHGNTIIINGQKTSGSKTEIEERNKSGFNYEYEMDYLNSISVSQKELKSLLKQLEKTEAYSVDYKDGKAYFIMDSFLDSSNGYLYSTEELEITDENNKSKLYMNDGNINILEKVKPNWYKVGGWH